MDRDEVMGVIVRETARVTGMDAATLDHDTRIHDLPLDSLQTIELVVAIEDALQVGIGCVERITIETLGGYADLVLHDASSMAMAA
jgi:acyl carrier protein